MERVETLLQKLQQQFNEGVSAELLLNTVQMLQLELAHLRDNKSEELARNETVTIKSAALVVPPVIQKPLSTATYAIPDVEKKIIGILQIDEAELAAENAELA